MTKLHLLPNVLAALLIALSVAVPAPYDTVLATVGLFALSGALTNWIAVHMLFERVPGLYGSGVIVTRFDDFKASILRLVREQVLNPERVDSILNRSAGHESIDLQPILKRLDLDAAFDQLAAAIEESNFGSMLRMVGGKAALEPLREPLKQRIDTFLVNATASPAVQLAIQNQIRSLASSEAFTQKLDTVLRARLDELTPEMVKTMVHDVIHRHLGWLVVWGGFFGGLIGLLSALVRIAWPGSL